MLGQYVKIELFPFMGQTVYTLGRGCDVLDLADGKDFGLVARLRHFRVGDCLFKISMAADDVKRETDDVLG